MGSEYKDYRSIVYTAKRKKGLHQDLIKKITRIIFMTDKKRRKNYYIRKDVTKLGKKM